MADGRVVGNNVLSNSLANKSPGTREGEGYMLSSDDGDYVFAPILNRLISWLHRQLHLLFRQRAVEGTSHSCPVIFVDDETSTPLQSGKRLIDPSSTALHKRIAQLEKLVVSMTSQNNSLAGKESKSKADFDVTDDSTELHPRFGRIGLENTETSYVENSHWTAVLDGIAELKDCFDNDPEAFEQVPTSRRISTPGPALLLGNFRMLDQQQILASIPGKQEVDGLVSTFFNTTSVYLLCIHGPTFLEEYDRFWKCPEKTSIMWVGLLFSIMCMASVYQRSSASAEATRQAEQRIHIFRERIVQCLRLADYTKCGPYTIETMLCYLSVEYTQATDNQTGLWLLLGIIVRLAVRMGYHRDASNSSCLSPFQAEMRRRIWAVLYMLDSAAADQYGIPRMVNESLADAREPLNLLDGDLDPRMESLPRSRPDHEPTLIGFLAIKNRLLSTRNIITDLTGYPNKFVSYKEILKLDKIIKEQFENLPAPLKMRPINKSLTDSTGVIANRIFLALISYKSRCMLHQHYLLTARTDDRYRYSRKACIESALDILHIQESIREESQIGRRLYTEQWKFETTVNHVFFLACTILSVDLNCDLSETPAKRLLGKEIFTKIISALQSCYNIWVESTDTSREVQKAVAMLRFILMKARRLRRISLISINDVGFGYDGLSTLSNQIDPALFNHDIAPSSWENYNIDMSQFDVNGFDTILDSTHDNNQMNTVCHA
ncbi:conserved hypothetical protein [Talaromyces stipitatus ATCC 10500]|uniref:Xylanolytic transcriptional activator regulatory domain-containing protein n=1 Tax=Talaromyces stipitatus (strain ATCC 10500 / CBS 375.48 / QM 6759 / NRRL 1006) TaxID=441959 RepID=B8MJA4_TALSN|nr:uncharacterized protein TSTA_041700 [Talaromyces stipitatus ATCC 10500]EED14693.1 conserved hypothetical protein [Talaromyces stipitatus ATCC 10500]